ncbi:MAG: hypothetical protein B6U76_04730 [Desulfurococcales archaeon ex4484_217_2]|nr:MAG: hypothetical protein B6U76_04730 [Desulfurococcales archaeon ex4484_217_2]
MRIGIFTHYIDKYSKNAPSLYQIDLIKKLVEKTNLEIVLIHHKESNLPIYRLAEEVIISKLPYLREREINKLNLDVIHFNAIPWSWWPSISKLNAPSIATVHGTIHWDTPNLDNYSSHIFRILKRILEKRVVKNITHLISVSKYVKKVLNSKLKISQEKVDTIYLPIDHNTFKPIDPEIIEKEKVKYRIKARYILHVSNYSRAKNPKVLLKSFYVIRRRIGDVILVIAGLGWDNSFVNKLIKALNLQDSVRILGWIPKEDLAVLYSGALALLHPSLHETFGFPIIEAMACGCPVIASNVMAIPEIVGNAAILCDPYDYNCFANVIHKILSDSQTREEIVKRELERAKLFNWDVHISRVIDVYSRAASKSR